MRRLLIVSPHFPPVSAADMQRVRMVLPFFRENGWEAEVLAVSPEQVRAPLDAWLVADLPNEVPVHRVAALGLKWSRLPGFRTLGLRALQALDRMGKGLLARERFDLVYFSTTVFETHVLGPRWRRKFGVPFVMDYQDPWVNNYYKERPHVIPPGGRVKYFFIDALHRWMEPRVLRDCAGITCVSPEYPKDLAQRYRSIKIPPALVQPFPGARRDFSRLPPLREKPNASDNTLHWTYVGTLSLGRGGPDMALALRGLFRALRDHASEDLRQRLRLHFIGTSYAPAGSAQKSVAHIAEEYSLGHLVEESSDRIPYADALTHLREADALIVPGSDDASYTASKIYPYLLARKPLLAVFHRDSTVVDLMSRVGGGVCVPFAAGDSEAKLAQQIADKWLSHGQHAELLPLNEQAFEPYTDRGSAATLCKFLESCLPA